jgi:hypothetical protein
MVNYFFDTYAIIELLMRNPSYEKYQDYPLITTVLNKIEVCWWALTHHDKNLSDILLKSLSNASQLADDAIGDALIFRYQHKKRNISFANAIGYSFARKNNLIFLTGDKEFQDLPGVRFVK